MNPAPFNARTRVHEYGGGAWLVHRNCVYFSNFADQQIYVADGQGNTRQLTRTPELRFANGVVDAARNRIIYVIEDHSGDNAEPSNLIGAVSLESGSVTFLTRGHDFYSSPTLSPDTGRLAWITWDHPDMPWDGTTLMTARIAGDGSLSAITRIAGGREESIQQPLYSSDGTLYFISDRSGWWNLYRVQHDAAGELAGEHERKILPVCETDAEFGVPHWVFGQSTYAFRQTETGADEIICTFSRDNQSVLSRLDRTADTLTTIATPFTAIDGISLGENIVTLTAASPTTFNAIVNVDLATGETQVIKASCNIDLDPRYYAIPEAIDYPSADGEIAHAFYYPPANKDFAAPADERPPLIVMCHGGPTGATSSGLALGKQFWTSRGFAVLDVNYRGSTGYGRTYRQKLNGQWGIVDVEDAVAGAHYLVDQGLADANRLAIRGGSAGGFTTLAALTFKNTFAAGASHYGVGDLEALAADTHKFESRYLDSMIGPYPGAIETYRARSPINHVDQLACPVIFFQGLDDKVVPPNQAEAMVAALSAKGIANAYVPFEGEQHGFRKAENIKRALDLELYFYGRVFGFTIADTITPIEIINLPPS
jgi:dipeptidyl aminopeptidase/acylaminoacyl peptidase